MAGSTANVKNWMHMSRWIVKLIRDEYGIDETRLRGTTTLDRDLGLVPAQIDHVLDIIAESFAIRFPDDGRDEIATLRELCTVACWLKGFYKRPDFISDYFERKCRAANPTLAA
jgi:hypothetical protein